MKSCKKCKELKPFSEYTKNKQKKDGYNIYCRICCNLKTQNWRELNPSKYQVSRKKYRDYTKEEQKDYMLRMRYGITLEEKNQMFLNQNNKCKLCQNVESDNKGFVVDHCHKSGKIRGILCSYCNKALGMFKDDPSFLEKAINYLKGDF